MDPEGNSRFVENLLSNRDPQQLGEVLSALEPWLTGVAVRFTKDPETAKDVVQNAFEKVLRHGAKFQGRSRLSTWMYRIVANEALMWLRSERRRGEVQRDVDSIDGDDFPDTSPGPLEEVARRECERLLGEAISRLSNEERDVVTGCALAEVSYAEYGARTATHPAAVKSRAFRARRHLRELLAV
jgi:RNA polymerase sigma-70 factor (ECF subfamily)